MISDNKVVSMNYTLTDDKGEVLDSSEGEPLEYLQGHGNIIPGLEKALTGLKTGDKKKIMVSPADGYGVYDPELKLTLEKKQFGRQKPETGMTLELHSDDGHVMQATITSIEGDTVHLDANHPLAGKTLHFDVEISGVRDATKDELEHGHPHGPDGHHHHHP